MTTRREPPIVPGMTIGRCAVDSDYADKHGNIRFTLDCLDCARRFHVGSSALREHVRGGIELRCPWCRPGAISGRKIRPAAPTCSVCGESGHNRRDCPTRDNIRSLSKYCRECSGLAHRRERPVCPECRQPHEDEPEMTIDDALRAPRNYDTTAVL